MKKRKTLDVKFFLVLAMVVVITVGCSSKSMAAKPIKLVVDGKDITSLAMPVFENDRTLVPVRFIAESVGANVDWNNKERKVTLYMGNTSVVLKINSHLVQYKDKETTYGLSDVAPKIIDERTYIPARLVSNALGIGIEWDNDNRVVRVDSSKTSSIEPFFDMKISSITPGQDITGKTDLQVKLNGMNTNDIAEIKYLLLDSDTAEGIVINRGTDLEAKYTWLPNLEDKGKKALVAAMYDEKGKFIAGDVVPVNMKVSPKVDLTGIDENEIIEERISLVPDINFVASYVKYEITNLDKNTTITTSEQDPQGTYNWAPMVEESGNYAFKVIAYDKDNKDYPSKTIKVKVNIQRELSLTGVSSGQNIDKPITLLASRNFNVRETQYVLRDPNTKKEEIIKTIPYGGYTWFPGPEYKGSKEVFVRVQDTRGTYHESDAIEINLLGTPKLLIQGIGPKQVITDEVNLKSNSNIGIDKVNYIAINPNTNVKKVLGKDVNPKEDYSFKPEVLGEGNWNIKAIGKYNGKDISSEVVPVKIYLGELHGPRPIIEKDKFLGLASELAKDSLEKTGMSAALQTAQAILETGWGQSVPVDKYNGKLSNNLFGIKRKGTEDFVISNTWEEYNGTTFRIDAEFRAYKTIGESWNDHKRLLLEAPRYEIFRDVMHDSTQGAWAIRRAGYATDSQYPIKLMDIIKRYNLQELDKVRI